MVIALRSDPTLENTALLTFVLVSTPLSHIQQGKTVTDKNVVFNLSRPDVACWQLVLLSNDKPSLHEAFAFAVHLHLGELICMDMEDAEGFHGAPKAKEHSSRPMASQCSPRHLPYP